MLEFIKSWQLAIQSALTSVAMRQMSCVGASYCIQHLQIESRGGRGVPVGLVDVVVGVDTSGGWTDAARVSSWRFEDDEIEAVVHFILIRGTVHDFGDDDEAERGADEAETDYGGRWHAHVPEKASVRC